jgi:hypothetical protein
MKPRKNFWKGLAVLVLLGGMTFLLNLPGVVRCHGEVDDVSQHGTIALNR